MATIRISDGLLEELRKRKFKDGKVRGYEEVIGEALNITGKGSGNPAMIYGDAEVLEKVFPKVKKVVKEESDHKTFFK